MDIKDVIVAFLDILRDLHDHTFDPLDDAQRIEWIRFEIEKQLKKYGAILN